MPPQAKNHRGWPATNRNQKRQGSSSGPSKEARPGQHLDFRPLPSGAVTEYNSVVSSHPVCDTLSRRPEELQTEAGSVARSWDHRRESNLEDPLELPGPRSGSLQHKAAPPRRRPQDYRVTPGRGLLSTGGGLPGICVCQKARLHSGTQVSPYSVDNKSTRWPSVYHQGPQKTSTGRHLPHGSFSHFFNITLSHPLEIFS